MQHLSMNGASPQVQSLIRIAAHSILESFQSEVRQLIMSSPELSNALPGGGQAGESEQNGGMLELSEHEVDMDYIEANAKDLTSFLQEALGASMEVVEENGQQPQSAGAKVAGAIDTEEVDSRASADFETQKEVVASNNNLEESTAQDVFPLSWNVNESDGRKLAAEEGAITETEAMQIDCEVSVEVNQGEEIEAIHTFPLATFASSASIEEALSAISNHIYTLSKEKYHGKGIGVKVKPTTRGALLSFLFTASEGVALEVYAGLNSHNGIQVVAKLLTPLAEADVAKEDEETMRLVNQAKTSIIDGLRSHFSNFDILVAVETQRLLKSEEQAGKNETIEPPPISASPRDDQVISPPPSSLEEDAVVGLDSVDSISEAIGALDKQGFETSSSYRGTASNAAGAKRQRDPKIVAKAKKLGVNVDKFEDGLRTTAAQELQQIIENSKKQGFLMAIQQEYTVGNDSSSPSPMKTADEKKQELQQLFKVGQQVSDFNLRNILDRPSPSPYAETEEELKEPPTQLPLHFLDETRAQALKKGEAIDIFAGPFGFDSPALTSESSSSPSRSDEFGGLEAFPPMMKEDLENDASYQLDERRLAFLVQELNRTSPDVYGLILDGNRDLLLSDNFLYLLKKANATETQSKTRSLYKLITDKTTSLYNELMLLMEKESVRHMETIRDICEVATRYQHDEKKFIEMMDVLKPRFDTSLLTFLLHVIREEERRHHRQGIDPSLAPNDWLKILRVIYRGVVAEFTYRYEFLIDLLTTVVRFYEHEEVQSHFFESMVEKTIATDLTYLRELALNMVNQIRSGNDAEANALIIEDPLLPNKIERLHSLIDRFLSEEYISKRMEDYEGDIAKEGDEVVPKHRNPVYQDEIDTLEEISTKALLEGSFMKSEEDEEESAKLSSTERIGGPGNMFRLPAV
eukprot:scaffold1435_cov162-Ochromonas_danica.AAC.10